MQHEDNPITEYVRRVNEETRRFAYELLTENERLRTRLPVLQRERDDARAEVTRLRQEVERHRRERSDPQEALPGTGVESSAFESRYAELEQQNFSLMNLYVASYRLHGTLRQDEVIATIREIITNLIGSEELGIFMRSRNSSRLRLVASMGIDAAAYDSVPLGSGIIGSVARSGRPFVAEEGRGEAGDHERTLTACYPLKVGKTVTGAIAIFRLLEQKPALEPIDRELFTLLSTQAAMALYCTELHGRLEASAGMTA